jgi:hypothetical protein
MKIHLVGVELFHADGKDGKDGRTEMTKLAAAFRNFAKEPNSHRL